MQHRALLCGQPKLAQSHLQINEASDITLVETAVEQAQQFPEMPLQFSKGIRAALTSLIN
jgi:hypothetical protein